MAALGESAAQLRCIHAGAAIPKPTIGRWFGLLRPWRRDDVPFVVAACQDPEVSRYSPVIPFPYTEADALGWFESQEPARLIGDGLDFAVVHSRAGDTLGAVGVKIDALLRSAEIG